VAVARSLSALANTQGGILLVGIADDGAVVGLADPKAVLAQVQQVAAFHLHPPLDLDCQIVQWGSAFVVVVQVPNSDHKPHALTQLDRYSQRVYLRQGAATVPVGKDQIKAMQKRGDPSGADVDLATLEPMQRLLIEYLAQHEQITLRQFCHIANCSKRRGQQIIVKSLRAGLINCFEQERDPSYSLGIPVDLQQIKSYRN
jgi:predicted HTH transcriptional regulator